MNFQGTQCHLCQGNYGLINGGGYIRDNDGLPDPLRPYFFGACDQVVKTHGDNVTMNPSSIKWDVSYVTCLSVNDNAYLKIHVIYLCTYANNKSHPGIMTCLKTIIFVTPLPPKKRKHLSSVQNPYDIPLYWLVQRDPYIGILQSPYKQVV